MGDLLISGSSLNFLRWCASLGFMDLTRTCGELLGRKSRSLVLSLLSGEVGVLVGRSCSLDGVGLDRSGLKDLLRRGKGCRASSIS